MYVPIVCTLVTYQNTVLKKFSEEDCDMLKEAVWQLEDINVERIISLVFFWS